VTFEHPAYPMTRAERDEARRSLEREGIFWYPVAPRGRSPALRKVLTLARATAVGAIAIVRHRAPVVHGRSTMPAAVAILLSKALGRAFLYDADCELSREFVDVGRWPEGGLRHRLLAGFERFARAASDSTVVLTDYTRRRILAELPGGAPVTVVPCCVDVERFTFQPKEREEHRRELGLASEPVFVYMGKVGSWYLVDETFALFRVARERLPEARLLVVSPDSPEAFRGLAGRHGVPWSACHVVRARHDEVPGWLSAADVGLSLIAPFASKLGCSPVKAGEYLAVGLPLVITRGIGDTTALVERERVGVVIEEQTDAAYRHALADLEGLLREGEALRARCRAAAEADVGLQGVGVPRYREVYAHLLARGGRTGA
jgi:glycosyltransferase involved in cell wall biosynthesis